MNTSSDFNKDATRAASQLIASLPCEGASGDFRGASRPSDAPSAMAFRPSALRMPPRSTSVAPWDPEDDDDKW